jgi:hypothetical protein
MTHQTAEERSLLVKFCRSYVAWLDAGAPDRQPYRRNVGLCVCAIHPPEWLKAMHAVQNGLAEEFGSGPYPFGGQTLYDYEAENHLSHLNPARVAWARKIAAEEPKGAV